MVDGTAWHTRLTWAAGAWFAAGAMLCAEEAGALKTGAAFRQQLAATMSVTWSERELRDALASVAQQLDIAVFLDRRIDPGQVIGLRLRDQSAEEVLRQLAEVGKAEWRAIGPVVYVGPAETATKLPTLAALRRQEAEKLPAETRERLLKTAAWKWNELAEPRKLLDGLASEAGVTVRGAEQIPHDLWPAVTLPPLVWTDRLSLLLAGFGMTFEIGEAGRSLTIVPRPESVTLEKRYSPRGVAATVAAQWRRAVPEAQIRVEQGKLVVRGLQEEHETIERLLAGPAGEAAKASKAKSKGQEQRYSLTVGPNDPAGAVVRKIAETLGKELKYDAAVLQKLKQNVPVSVKDVTLDELLTATLKPLGLRYRMTEGALEVVEE